MIEARVVCALYLLLLPGTALAEIETVTVRGSVESSIPDAAGHKKLASVRIQVIEIDNEPAEASVKAHISLSAEDGAYNLKLDKGVIEDIDEVTALKIKFWKDGYVPVAITVGPIVEDWAEREGAIVTKEGAYVITRDISLRPVSYVPSGLEITRLNVATKYTIFREDNLERSPSPFRGKGPMRYFRVPDDIKTLKSLAGQRHQPGQNPVFERVHGEVRPLMVALMELIAMDCCLAGC